MLHGLRRVKVCGVGVIEVHTWWWVVDSRVTRARLFRFYFLFSADAHVTFFVLAVLVADFAATDIVAMAMMMAIVMKMRVTMTS